MDRRLPAPQRRELFPEQVMLQSPSLTRPAPGWTTGPQKHSPEYCETMLVVIMFRSLERTYFKTEPGVLAAVSSTHLRSHAVAA